MLKALGLLVLATAVTVLSVATAAAQDAGHNPNSIAGCYEITSGLPESFTAGFCLDNAWQSEFTATSPAGACVRHMSWEATPDGFTPVDWPDDFIASKIGHITHPPALINSNTPVFSPVEGRASTAPQMGRTLPKPLGAGKQCGAHG